MTAKGRVHPFLLRVLDWQPNQFAAILVCAHAGFNDTHLTEILAEREEISIGRETLRGILRSAGHHPKRKRRPKKHYRRRERSATKGLMVLWDGSPHRCFGEEQLAGRQRPTQVGQALEDLAIQPNSLRVSGKDRDTLQAVIALLKEQDLGIDMQFQNYR